MNRVRKIASAIDEKKGAKLVLLNMEDHSISADYFLIAEGDNPKHVRAIAENIMDELSSGPEHAEGMDSRNWILLDYGEVWVHLFTHDQREFYDLDGLWVDRKISPDELGLESAGNKA